MLATAPPSSSPAAAIAAHAPAKLNLALHVVGRRDDGYHLIESLVVFCELGDRIEIAPAESDRLVLRGPFAGDVPDGPDNLVVKAREAAREVLGGLPPVSITLEKNLPVASGIGGGSSDAAATLSALARWAGRDVSDLGDAGLALGADLPMCLAARPLIARGIGERLEVLEGFPSLDLVLVNPGGAVATPAVYAALEHRQNPPLRPLAAAGREELLGWLAATRNDLEAPAIGLLPAIGEVLAELTASGAAFARMSGSGATCFGIFPGPAAARQAKETIAARRPEWFVRATRGLASGESFDGRS